MICQYSTTNETLYTSNLFMKTKIDFFVLFSIMQMEKLDEEEEEKKSRTSSVGSSHTPGNHDDAKTTQDTSPSNTTDNMCSVTSEAMEVTGSEEGRQLPTMADDQVTEPGQTMDEQQFQQ